jgi:beta-lactam-binding protein with PASTA domain
MFPIRSTVPSVVGLPGAEAERLGEAARLMVTVVAPSHSNNVVIAQDPAVGESVPFGELMTIWLGG